MLVESLEWRTLLAPLTNSGTAADPIYDLPASANVVFLEDDGVSGNGMLQLRSGNGTFDTTVFANPTGSLTINRGDAANAITVNSLPDFNRRLNIGSITSPFATVTFAGAVSLSSAVLFASGTTVNSGAAATLSVPSFGMIDLRADNMDINSTATLTTGTNGLVKISTPTSDRTVNVGTETANQLSLTGAELNRITADTISIGDGFTGALTVSAPMTLSSNFELHAATSININQSVTLTAGKSFAAGGNSSLAALALGSTGSVVVSGAGGVLFSFDSIDINANATINAGSGTVNIAPLVGGGINLGTETVNQLSLTDAELDRITAGTLQIGDDSSGAAAKRSRLMPNNRRIFVKHPLGSLFCWSTATPL